MIDPIQSLKDAQWDAKAAIEIESGTINPFVIDSNQTFQAKFSSAYKEILSKRRELPVFEQRQAFLDLVKNNQIIVLVGETGSGKTTQIPQFLNYALLPHLRQKMIACTQPRRVAAMSIAKRVAEEMDVQVGEQVGYSIRFEDCTCSKTIIKYMTDGMLLREAATDNQLMAYDAIILDEAHERTVQTDILMGLVKDICKKRPQLKLVVMSATLDAEKFCKYFDAPMLSVAGRSFPVEIIFSKQPERDYLEAAIQATIKIHTCYPPGDILVFLTGEEEIEDACSRLRNKRGLSDSGELLVVPLYSSLPPAMQQRIFDSAPENGRKVVVATNIAETSLTIDGIVYVVDPGFSKQKVYNPRTSAESLVVTPISQAAAMQRAGRAGRTREGKCFRLYTKESFEKDLPQQTIPETLRSNICHTVLQLLQLQVPNLIKFDFMDPPVPETLMRALEMLAHSGAIDESVKLTPLGKLMAEFPLDPELARALIESSKNKCSDDMLTIVSMLNVPWMFLRPKDKRQEADECKKDFDHALGDHMCLLNTYNKYIESQRSISWCKSYFINQRSLKAAENIRAQLVRSMQRADLPVVKFDPINRNRPEHYAAIQASLLAGFFMKVAVYDPRVKCWRTVADNSQVMIHPSSCIKDTPRWILYHENVRTSAAYVRTVLRIQGEQLQKAAPNYFIPNLFKSDIKEALQTVLKKRQSDSEKRKKQRLQDHVAPI